MDRDDAETLVAMMHTSWPAARLLDAGGGLTARGEMFANDLERYSSEEGLAAIETLRLSVRYYDGPTPGMLFAELAEARRRIPPAGAAALPEGLELVGEAIPMPDWAHEAIAAFHVETGWIPPADTLDKQARIEAVRAKTLRELESPDAPESDIPQFKRKVQRTACGAEWGAEAVFEDGMWRCPGCGSPTSEGCLPARVQA